MSAEEPVGTEPALDMTTVFLTSVQTAVGTSMTAGKPLIVYISEPSSDSAWISSVMSGATLALIKDKAVALRLTKETPECQMFEQVFPNTQAPSVFIVRFQVVLDIIHGNVTQDEFHERISKVLDPPQSQPQVPLSTVPTTIPQSQSPHPSASPQQPTSTPSPSLNSNQLPPSASASASASQQSAVSEPRKTLKEQSAEIAAKKYKEEQMRLKQTQREERERIRRLVKADQEERKAQERQRRMSHKGDETTGNTQGVGEISVEQLRENIKKNKLEVDSCALSIRLLDGHSLQHVFKATEKLTDVRTWIDANRSDGSTPYAFHRMIPRVTYEASDEEKTLTQLELTPRSALILKPFNSYTEAYTHASASQGGIISRVWGGISSFWSQAPQNNPTSSSSSSTISDKQQQDGSHRVTYQDEHQNQYEHQHHEHEHERHTPIFPAQSPQSSFYASPLLGPEAVFGIELNRQPSHLSINDTSRGGGNQTPRSRTPGVGEHPAVLSRMGSTVGESSSGLPVSLSRTGSNIRTLDSPRLEEDRVLYNGNQTNLEDDANSNDQDKRKKKINSLDHMENQE
ncbi:CYFA0S18e01772g1_1 [Cyberlindnera fabianii]|uniref:CYFA0S18e01772g1_1 n=1 Tax=Cyberlindnera fabianii TaxID=36022 RepID=A0A061B655_CYBFA|nr:UBX domain-containing protein 7 [Cyberlindnera fabianii]CDR45441.1 CYFA0S18e01772g1_1 [Cyberlindnera fabianii]